MHKSTGQTRSLLCVIHPLQKVYLEGKAMPSCSQAVSDKLTQSRHKVLLQQSAAAMLQRTDSFISQQAHVTAGTCHSRCMSSLQGNLQSQACLPLSGSPVSACSSTPSALAWHHRTGQGGSTAWHRQCISAAAAWAEDHELHHCKPQSQMCELIPTPLLPVCTLERWSHHAFMSGQRDLTCTCRLT